MRFLSAIAILLVSACGDAPPPPQSPDAAIADEQFETARDGAGDLITGTAADWNAATEEAKNVYAMGSAEALLAGGGVTQQRASLAAAFRRCMDAEVARATPSSALGDVSYACALGFQNGAHRS